MFKFTGDDARRLNLNPRRFLVDYRANIEVQDALGDIIKGGVDDDQIVDDIDFWDPSDMKDSWMVDYLSRVELGNDVLCYYRGNPDFIIILRDDDHIEYYSGKIVGNLEISNESEYWYTEYTEEVIADLPKWHYWVAGNPDFDIKIKYG